MISAKCCYCGFETLNDKTTLYRLGTVYKVYQCCQCGLVQIHPRPTTEFLEELYTDSYSKSAPNRRAIKRYQRTLRTIWKLSMEGKSKRHPERRAQPRLLDIGCNLGFFLQEAEHLGFVTVGIDVSQAAVDFVNKGAVISAHKATVEEFSERSEDHFEVVTSFDVMEHVVNPRTFLNEACSLVKAGGMLVIGTPNVDSLFAYLNFGVWYYADPPYHINYFGKNLINFVEMRGFKLVKACYTFAPSMITQYLPVKWKTLQKMEPRCAADLHNFEERVSVRRRFVELCFDTLNFATSWLRIGDTMVLYFKKIVSGNEDDPKSRECTGVRA